MTVRLCTMFTHSSNHWCKLTTVLDEDGGSKTKEGTSKQSDNGGDDHDNDDDAIENDERGWDSSVSFRDEGDRDDSYHHGLVDDKMDV